MAGFALFSAKDIDGRQWRFAQQNKQMSCGPTSVKIAKELVYNRSIGEEVIRGLVGLQYSKQSNSGKGLLDSARDSEARWTQDGAIEKMVLPAVRLQPLAIPHARFARGIDALRPASRNHPAILGFNWNGGGGHFVVCVGPCKSDPSRFVILDPDGGLQYLSVNKASSQQFSYKPSYGQVGTIDRIGFIVT